MTNVATINIFNQMINDDVIYAFHGDFNYTVVNTLLTDIKKGLHHEALDVKKAKKTYKILVECLENIHKHTSRRSEKENNEGIFVLLRDPDGYIVAMGNSIYINEVDKLKSHLDEINSLDRVELKKKYRESLMQATISDKGGAGMGMLDIALKSGKI